MKQIIGAIVGLATLVYLFMVCSPAGKNKTGHEYMPDMAHPVGYEANVYSAYEYNHWDATSTFTKAQLSNPRGKVSGTVPRGATGVYYTDAGMEDVLRGKNAPNAISTPINGEAPFYYENDVNPAFANERLRCEKEMVNNPYPITAAGLSKAKTLYNTYCGICHGEAGDGQGWLYAKPDSKYPAAPKSFITDDMIAAGNGRYYYAIMHGKNVMGGYSDKLSFEERWQVIHYIRSLQAGVKNLEYSESANTLSNIEKPAKGEATGAPRIFVAPAAQ
jgi:mono/diheme cytochrome c family protein